MMIKIVDINHQVLWVNTSHIVFINPNTSQIMLSTGLNIIIDEDTYMYLVDQLGDLDLIKT